MSTTAGAYVTDSRAWYDPFSTFISDPTVNPPDANPVPSSNPSISNHGFTGHRHNNTGTNNLGLIYMNARYYMPEIGRFISPDTIVPEPGNPQSYNRYSYVLNSPMNYTDPTGHRECELICEGDIVNQQELQFGSAYGGDWVPDQQAANAEVAETVLVDGTQIIASIAWEPLDWFLALSDGLQWHDAPGMLPFIPATVGSKVDDLLQALKYLPISRADEVSQWSGKIVSYVLEEETVMYRVWGGDTDLVGSWLTPIKPGSSESARQLLSLPPQNSALNVSEVHIPAGTRVQFGTAAPAFGQPGGGLQIRLLDLIPRSAFGPGELLP